MKQFNGKAIYNPSGKAGEYSYWACNFFTGCSNNCTYCYCKFGVLSSTWSETPKLKKCFKDEDHALGVFKKELLANLEELRRYGLFFTFTSDPMLDETMDLTLFSIEECIKYGIPVKILTKRADTTKFCFLGGVMGMGAKQKLFQQYANLIAIGFTLTGHDELESGASSNAERIEAMQQLHAAGFKTWASIEPVIDFPSSCRMIEQTAGFCNLYKIGLKSGVKYPSNDLARFIDRTCEFIGVRAKLYFKDSLLIQSGINRNELPDNCVGRDYNIFTN